MKDLTDPRWITLKGLLFFVVAIISSALLLLQRFEIRTALLFAISIWGFCRAYYFAFYVIEHYVDPSYHFSGLISFTRYMITRRNDNRPA